MRLVETVGPTQWPVTVAEARLQCALGDDTTHDTLLDQLIRSVTREVEARTGSKLVSRTMRLDLDGFPSRDIDLGTYPVQSVTSVKYDDDDNAEQTVSASDYYTNLVGMTPSLRAVDYWPSTYLDKLNRVRITFVAGYANVEDIPDDLKQAILAKVYQDFYNRDGSGKLNPYLVDPHRRISV